MVVNSKVSWFRVHGCRAKGGGIGEPRGSRSKASMGRTDHVLRSASQRNALAIFTCSPLPYHATTCYTDFPHVPNPCFAVPLRLNSRFKAVVSKAPAQSDPADGLPGASGGLAIDTCTLFP
jgi:hypothetical protein